MSMEVSVLFNGRIPERAKISAALGQCGFPFTIASSVGSLERHSGFLPMRFRGEETGAEFVTGTADDLIGETGEDFTRWSRCATLRWGGDPMELAAAYGLAVALARVLEGAVFDHAEGRLVPESEASALAARFLHDLLASIKPGERGTKPTDLRHYLKPLLRQREDLVLKGRFLFIRPIRHILRGVFFDRTSDKYSFNVHLVLHPLSLGRLFGWSDTRYYWQVWRPHFEPFLMDALAFDLLGPAGRIVSLGDLGATGPIRRGIGGDWLEERVTALLLGGERAKAEALIETFAGRHPDSDWWRGVIERARAILARDLDEIVAEHHDRERAAAREHKVEAEWLPSPFPCEVPPSQRAAETDETRFGLTPWPHLKLGLVVEPPSVPGETLHADGFVRRDGRLLAVSPVSEEEARRRHRNFEPYMAFRQLAAGSTALLRHFSGESEHDPRRIRREGYERPHRIYLTLFPPGLSVAFNFEESWQRRGVLVLYGVEVDRMAGEERTDVWSVGFYPEQGADFSIRDHRPGGKPYETFPITERETEMFEGTVPDFASTWDLIDRGARVMDHFGVGHFLTGDVPA